MSRQCNQDYFKIVKQIYKFRRKLRITLNLRRSSQNQPNKKVKKNPKQNPLSWPCGVSLRKLNSCPLVIPTQLSLTPHIRLAPHRELAILLPHLLFLLLPTSVKSIIIHLVAKLRNLKVILVALITFHLQTVCCNSFFFICWFGNNALVLLF